jgi:hypothetical protein
MHRILFAAASLATACVVAAAIAYAAVPDERGVIHGCRGPAGFVRVIEAGSCHASEVALDWVQSAGYEAWRSVPSQSAVEINAVMPDPYQHVTSLPLPPGSYQVTTTIRATKPAGDGILTCVTFTAPDFATSVIRAAVGTGPGDSRVTTLNGGGGLVDLPAGGTADLKCRQNPGATGPNPVIDLVDIAAVRIGTITQGAGS